MSLSCFSSKGCTSFCLLTGFIASFVAVLLNFALHWNWCLNVSLESCLTKEVQVCARTHTHNPNAPLASALTFLTHPLNQKKDSSLFFFA